MTYDEELSRDVSLSKVLDAMLYDNEPPEIVVSFLEKYEDEIQAIFRESLCWQRLFQLDFFFKCGGHETDWILEHLKKVPLKVAAYFVWQICKSVSKVADAMKFRIRQQLKWIYEFEPSRHPYTAFDGKQAEAFDCLLFAAAKDDTIAETCASIRTETYAAISPYFYKSLFRDRIFQLDVFMACDEIKQWHMLNALKNVPLRNKLRFQKQLLDSNASNAVKEKLLESFTSPDVNALFDMITSENHELSDIIQTSKTFDELYMQLMLFGESNLHMSDVLAYFLSGLGMNSVRSTYLKILKDWVDFDRDGLDVILNVSSLIEYLYGKQADI